MRTRLLAPERRSGFYEAPLEIPGCHGVLRSDGLLDGDAPESPEARSAGGSVFLDEERRLRSWKTKSGAKRRCRLFKAPPRTRVEPSRLRSDAMFRRDTPGSEA